MTPDDPILISELRQDEGVRYSPYKDPVGIDTVGVGHNLKAHPLAVTYPLTDEAVNVILSQDLAGVFNDLDRCLPWWRDLTQARQRVLISMAFNLGISGLMKFRNTLDAVQKEHYQIAAEEMMRSQWAKQVGKRANRLAKMMVEG